ncbi:unnamed protein product [Polarella glacialis]|uniref:Uncharacterized protein n=1 Tax=Polarella glacialis TaxID=89957 RepID=A0A813K200_POLGL|nr:unnamed protein product [Polarella glacialis]
MMCHLSFGGGGKLAKLVVFKGGNEKTATGLKMSDLMKNKTGRVVTRKQHAAGKKAYGHLKAWTTACQKARKDLGIKGFVPIKKGTSFYKAAKAIYKSFDSTSGGSGEADALFCSGHCHEHGLHGCPVDLTAAAEMYQLAAEEGHTVAQWRLGELLEFGRGAETSEPDEAKAAHWYRLAAEEGYAQAQSALALLLEDGRGVPQDEAAALRWHLAAAEQGQAVSQYCAACCLAAGRGCQVDSVAAEHKASARPRPEASSGPFDPDYDAEEGRPRASSVPSVPSVLVQADLGNDSNDLLGLAQRIALQLGGLDEAEASELLDELLAEVPSLGLQELLEHEADDMEARPMVSHA